MPTLIDRHGRRVDHWIRSDSVPDDAQHPSPSDPFPSAGPQASLHAPQRCLLLPLADWRLRRGPLLAEVAATGGAAASRLRLGVELGPADEPGDIAGDLAALSLIAIAFPRFTDGRGYSIARTLRGQYSWQGELRAVGDVLRDQLFYLARCGFDTFALRDDQNVDASLSAFRDFSEAYQAAVDRGPLFARRHAPEVRHAGS